MTYTEIQDKIKMIEFMNPEGQTILIQEVLKALAWKIFTEENTKEELAEYKKEQ
jgi:hypothetical protein